MLRYRSGRCRRDRLADDDVYSFRPAQESERPWIAASVRTPGGLLEGAADSHESVASEALVIPISSGRPTRACRPRQTTRRFSSRTAPLGQRVGRERLVSPDSMTVIRRSICRTMILDACRGSTHPASGKPPGPRPPGAALRPAHPRIRRTLPGPGVPDGQPSWPTSTCSPSWRPAGADRLDTETGCSFPEPSSGVMRTLRALSSSLDLTRPVASAIGADLRGTGPRRARPHGQTLRDVVGRPTPPVWKVRIVSCVPGSPIDWAAMMPTASPMSTSLPVASERP